MLGKNRYSSWSEDKSASTEKDSKSEAEKLLVIEKMLEEVLWKNTGEMMKSTLASKMKRKPLEKDVRAAFQIMINNMKTDGVWKKMIDAYLQPDEPVSSPRKSV